MVTLWSMKTTLLLMAAVCAAVSLSAQEPHLQNIRQLTYGGDNAEAYFDPSGELLSFQSNNAAWGLKCDQIFELDIAIALENKAEYKPSLISTGKGRTTCAYYMPDGNHILYASTHEGGDDCPPEPEPRKDGKYLWSIYPSYDIYVADLGGNITKKLTDRPGYDAEAVVSPKGDKIVYTSTASGDLELWIMDIDGSNKRQITNELGYDGGAFFSPDGEKLVFRSSRPKTAGRTGRVQGAPRAGPRGSDQHGDLHRQRRRYRFAADHQAWQSQLGPLLPPFGQEDHLLVEPCQRARIRLPALPHQR